MTEPTPLVVRPVAAADFDALVPGLTDILHACVHGGASVGFILPFEAEEAERYWIKDVRPAVLGGGVAMLVAAVEGRVVGTVQLDHDTRANQRHRAEVRKLLVHPSARRRGVGRALMAAIEDVARDLDRTLLTLDTRTHPDEAGEPLYLSLGYEIAGRIPDYCRDTLTPRLDPTTLMYKRLAPRPTAQGA